MSFKINVQPDALKRCAGCIEEQCNAYEKTYRDLYAKIDAMSISWQGKDNQAYTNQIHGFEKDFIAMTQLMRNYVSFLRNSAQAYCQIQDDRAAKARTLTN
ncbi:MAG: WXG100 family type VII secretion target [Erysipelotrichaceae bacterium]|jgi:WXG100 family type VII secretion target|nr:WXG100 family type VII secretion target [Erysipelotrichaceae bacterium]MCI9524416.1 WXG100 family type VII secretion target [Erysipelotrichaceae bacterium]